MPLPNQGASLLDVGERSNLPMLFCLSHWSSCAASWWGAVTLLCYKVLGGAAQVRSTRTKYRIPTCKLQPDCSSR